MVSMPAANMASLFFWVLFLHALGPVWCYPSGAPASSCVDMMPRHGTFQPQPGPAPYILETSASTFTPGEALTVVIKGPDYSGLLLEARSGSDGSALGTWQMPPANTKLLECSGNKQGAITHSSTAIKNNSTVYTWIPPASVKTIVFRATIAQQRTVFWVNVMSSSLTSRGGTSLDVSNRAEKICSPALMLIPVYFCQAFTG